ncbi:MAG: transketolase, partial [Rhizobium sp.]
RKEWEDRLEKSEGEKKAQFVRRFSGELEGRLSSAIDDYKKKLAETKPTVATRKASEDALEVINGFIPETIGGSADLTPSNNTKTSQMKSITPTDFSGRYMHWGIREHGMAAAMNGIALHGGLIPYSGGFLIFSDYCRPPLRLAALMGIRAIHVLTHDSIGVGEDGPTHQPVEQVASLRAIPNFQLFRPADATETAECWQIAIKTTNRPSGLALTRQNLLAARTEYSEKNLCEQGAYTLAGNADAKVTIFASGSEVELAVAARTALEGKGISTRVVSVPCTELFFEQPDAYRKEVIGNSPVKVAVEAGVREGWDAFIGPEGAFIGMKGFGASAPYKDVYKHFGITTEAVVAAAEAKLS